MNEELSKNIMKTGTSLVGIVCKDGVVMASDRKVTLGGQLVSDKDFPKTVQLNKYVVLSMAGTVSDAQVNNRIITAQLKLKELRDKKRLTVKEAASLIATMKFQAIRRPSMIPPIVGNLLGGFNEDGSFGLYNLTVDGVIKEIRNYDAVGSGMIIMWGFLEANYKENMTIKEGIELATKAIMTATERDTASGHGIDVFTITKDGIKHVSKKKGEWKYTEE